MWSSNSATPSPSTTSTSRSATGEFFSLLGPSGCGKTTTLRMIGGFEAPTSGLIELQGQDVTWLPPYKRNVNTVFQNYALFPHLTIYENVAFGLRRKGIKDAEVKTPGHRHARARRAARLRAPQADPDLGRPGAARRARPGADQQAGRAAPRRAARRARPEAAQADAGRAQADPAGGRDHLHLRDPRPGRGDDDVRSHRRHEPAAATSSWASRRSCTSARRRASWRASWASATCCRAPSRATTARTRRSASRTTRAVRAPRAWSAARPTSSVGVRPEKIRLREADCRRRRRATTTCRASSATPRTSA